MKYSIYINQLAFSTRFPELDIIDAAIFDFMSQFMLSKGIEILDDEYGRWYWINYNKVAEDLPIINIKSRDGIYRRIKKLAEVGLLEAHPDNMSHRKTYFRQGKYFDIVHFKPSDENRVPRTDIRGTLGQETEGTSDENTRDTYIKDTSIKDSISIPSSVDEGERVIAINILDKYQTPKYAEAKKIALYLLESIITNQPTHKYANNIPAINEWIVDLEKAIRLDGRTEEQLIFIIDYLFYKNTHEAIFWAPNIQSGKKLREEFDRLKNRIKAEIKNAKGTKDIARQAKQSVDQLEFTDD